MAVQYRVVPKKPPGGDDSKIKYYPALTNRRPVDLRYISKRISAQSSLNSVDIFRIAEAFFNVIPEILQEGHNVKLGDLGTFSLSLKAGGMADPKKVTRDNINEVRMNFVPGKLIKERLRETEFDKIK